MLADIIQCSDCGAGSRRGTLWRPFSLFLNTMPFETDQLEQPNANQKDGRSVGLVSAEAKRFRVCAEKDFSKSAI